MKKALIMVAAAMAMLFSADSASAQRGQRGPRGRGNGQCAQQCRRQCPNPNCQNCPNPNCPRRSGAQQSQTPPAAKPAPAPGK